MRNVAEMSAYHRSIPLEARDIQLLSREQARGKRCAPDVRPRRVSRDELRRQTQVSRDRTVESGNSVERSLRTISTLHC